MKRMKHEAIQHGIDVLKQGGQVAFPTETMDGLGARVFDHSAAVSGIFLAKGRTADNPVRAIDPVSSGRVDHRLEKVKVSCKHLGVLCLKENLNREGPLFYERNCRHELDYARNLFTAFWEAEESGVEILLAETVKEKGNGVALVDRLERAARGKI